MSAVVAGAVLAASIAPAFAQNPAPVAAAAGAAGGDTGSCQVADEEAFRAQIDKLTFAAIQKGLNGVDYPALVDAAWHTTGTDSVLDARVTKSIAEVKEETGSIDRLKSLVITDAAQKLANSVAERTYRSEEMKKAIDAISIDVSNQLSSKIEIATLDAAGPAVACVKTYLGARYGSTITRLVAADTGSAFEKVAEAGNVTVTSTDLALQSKGAIAGAVVLVARRALANLAKRIGQRVVGAVLEKVVSTVAGGIGLLLIGNDLWNMLNGSLPIIEEELKSDGSKTKVKAEIAVAFSDQLQTHLHEVSAGTAERILQVWHEFKAAHAKVVDLADRRPEFKSFLDTASPEQLPRVDRIVQLVLATEGEDGLVKRLADGTLDSAAKRLPESVLSIATDTGSLDQALGWQRLAGADVEKVAALEIHRIAKPSEFTADTLKKLIALDDKFAVSRIGALPRVERETISGYGADRQKSLARALTPQELTSFAGYVQGLKQNAGVRLASAIADDPHRMRLLADPGLQQAILSSRDQDAAVGMMLRDGSLFDVLNLQQDFSLTTDGDVSPMLLWHKHTAAVSSALAVAALVLLMLWRLLFGGRRRRYA